MDAPQEFHYRIPGRVSGQRPGSHPGSSVGSGQEFVTHMSLFNRPDPRRLDLRASLRSLNGDWLVRVNRQRAGVAVRAIVDVSASMNFGSQRPKLHVVADFLEALGLSAFRVGDAVGMMAFDATERSDLFMPARVSRGMGSIMASALRAMTTPEPPTTNAASSQNGSAGRGSSGVRGVSGSRSGDAAWGSSGTQVLASPSGLARAAKAAEGSGASRAHGIRGGFDALVSGVAGHHSHVGRPVDGLEEAASHLAGQQGLVFLVSDYHWPLQGLDVVLDLLAHASVIPIVVWDPAEIEPPESNALASLRDAESGARRTLWMRPKLRDDWRRAVTQRRAEIDSFFASRGISPFYIEGAFDADALSRYFFEADV